jgi:hypothetical protein
MSAARPHSNRERRRSSSVTIDFGGRSEDIDDLLVLPMQRIEGVEELFLRRFPCRR